MTPLNVRGTVKERNEVLLNSFLASADKFKMTRTQFFNYGYGFVNPSAFK